MALCFHLSIIPFYIPSLRVSYPERHTEFVRGWRWNQLQFRLPRQQNPLKYLFCRFSFVIDSKEKWGKGEEKENYCLSSFFRFSLSPNISNIPSLLSLYLPMSYTLYLHHFLILQSDRGRQNQAP